MKRTIAIFSAVIMLASVLSGCAGTRPEETVYPLQALLLDGIPVECPPDSYAVFRDDGTASLSVNGRLCEVETADNSININSLSCEADFSDGLRFTYDGLEFIFSDHGYIAPEQEPAPEGEFREGLMYIDNPRGDFKDSTLFSLKGFVSDDEILLYSAAFSEDVAAVQLSKDSGGFVFCYDVLPGGFTVEKTTQMSDEIENIRYVIEHEYEWWLTKYEEPYEAEVIRINGSTYDFDYRIVLVYPFENPNVDTDDEDITE